MPTLELERELFRRGFTRVVGVDEAGRGPLAGPVVAGAVVLPLGLASVPAWLEGVDDSKGLTPRRREACLQQIIRYAEAVAVGLVPPGEIDDLGIGEANRRAMLRAIGNLAQRPDYALVDFVPRLQPGLPFQALAGGDRRCYSIAAASIVAKVTRDRLMERADQEYPVYRFARHKGYPTAEHLRLLALHGPSPIHRRSFSPVRACLKCGGAAG